MNTRYVLGAFDRADLAQKYFESASVLTCEIVSLFYNPHGSIKARFPGLSYHKDGEYSGNTGRHRDLRKVLAEVKPDSNDWIIFTDVHDVRFQADIKLPDDLDIVFAPEGKNFGEIDFWSSRYPDAVWNSQAYNAGTFAMRYYILEEFWDYLENEWQRFRQWYVKAVPITGDVYPFNSPQLNTKIKDVIGREFNGYADTYYFNEFITTTKYRVGTSPTLFACYAFNYELGNLVVRDGKTYTKDGHLVSVVHYNGNSKKYMEESCPTQTHS